MTAFERAILEAFADRFPRSAQAQGGRAMRIAGRELFPTGDSAPPDEKEAFLEAVDELARQGIARPSWKRHRRGEELASLSLVDASAAFELLGRQSPERVAALARERAALEAEGRGAGGLGTGGRELMSWLSLSLGPEDGALGVDEAFIADLALLSRFAEEASENLPLRALSIRLYRDSKRLETLLPLARRLAQRAERAGRVTPDFSSFERSWPESAMAGDLRIHFRDGRSWELGGAIAGLPLSTLSRVGSIQGPGQRPRVLSVENKESFQVLASGGSRFDGLVYVGGHLNEAARLLIAILSRSGFDISHAGDLDPDGLLILEEVGRAAGRQVEPWRMDLAVFERYRPWARRLEPKIVARLERLSPETLASPSLASLAVAIRESRLGIEQEIIDYGS